MSLEWLLQLHSAKSLLRQMRAMRNYRSQEFTNIDLDALNTRLPGFSKHIRDSKDIRHFCGLRDDLTFFAGPNRDGSAGHLLKHFFEKPETIDAVGYVRRVHTFETKELPDQLGKGGSVDRFRQRQAVRESAFFDVVGFTPAAALDDSIPVARVWSELLLALERKRLIPVMDRRDPLADYRRRFLQGATDVDGRWKRRWYDLDPSGCDRVREKWEKLAGCRLARCFASDTWPCGI